MLPDDPLFLYLSPVDEKIAPEPGMVTEIQGPCNMLSDNNLIGRPVSDEAEDNGGTQSIAQFKRESLESTWIT